MKRLLLKIKFWINIDKNTVNSYDKKIKGERRAKWKSQCFIEMLQMSPRCRIQSAFAQKKVNDAGKGGYDGH